MNTQTPRPSVSRIRLTKPQLRMMDVLISETDPPIQVWKLARQARSGRQGYRVAKRLQTLGLVTITSPGMKDDDWVRITREGVALMMGDR